MVTKPRPPRHIDHYAIVGDRRKVLVTHWGGIRIVEKTGERYPGGAEKIEDYTVAIIDVKRTDREYWHSVRQFLEWLGQGLERHHDWEKLARERREDLDLSPWPKRAYKILRQGMADELRKGWDDVLPKSIVEWAKVALETEQHGRDFCDNARVAKIGNTAQIRRYKRQKARGCCGFCDWIAVGPDGNRYVLGFNYGH